MSINYKKLVFMVFIGYIVFVPSGPFPITMPFIGINLDVFIGIILMLILIPVVPKLFKYYPNIFCYSILLYIATTFITAVFSKEIYFSLSKWVSITGYVLVSFLVPPIIFRNSVKIRTIIFGVAFCVGIIIWYLYLFKGYGESARFELTTNINAYELGSNDIKYVDPNMTAIGLLMTCIIYIPNINLKYKLKIILKFGMFLVIITAAIITVSRSAIVAFFGGIILVVFLLLIEGVIKNRFEYLKKSFGFIISMFSMVIMVVLFSKKIIYSILERILGSAGDKERIFLIQNSIEIFSKNIKSVFFGQGFFTTNPHNEWLRHLSSSGLLGFAAFFLIILIFYLVIVSKIKKGYFFKLSAMSLFMYINIAILFYGHTKSLWIAFMFISILYFENKHNVESITKWLKVKINSKV